MKFQNFLEYPEKVPDARTIRLFRERMATTGKEGAFWEELKGRLSGMGLEMKSGRAGAKDSVLVRLGGVGTGARRWR